MKVYLCGPMTLNVAPNLNRAAFDEAAAHLRSAGHQVFSPAENGDGLDYAGCMRMDIEAVLDADAVVTLPRWDEGTGTRVEVAVALAIGIPVYSHAAELIEIYPASAGREALSRFVGVWASAVCDWCGGLTADWPRDPCDAPINHDIWDLPTVAEVTA